MAHSLAEVQQVRKLFRDLQRHTRECLASGKPVDVDEIEMRLRAGIHSKRGDVVVRGLAEFVGSAYSGSVQIPTLKRKA